MYYKDGKISSAGFKHLMLDINPYNKYGNASKDDLPIEGENYYQNKGRYDNDFDAQWAREIFEEGWQGIKE